MQLFLSYNFNDQKLIRRITYYLKKQPIIIPYCYGSDASWLKHIKKDLTRLKKTPAIEEETVIEKITSTNMKWRSEVGKKVTACENFIFFVGRKIGDTQKLEALFYAVQNESKNIVEKAIVVKLPDAGNIPEYLFQMSTILIKPPSNYKADESSPILDESLAIHYAERITKKLIGPRKWIPPDDIPIGYPFEYEKDIIEAYTMGGGKLTSIDLIDRGCPVVWPEVPKIAKGPTRKNPVSPDIIGSSRNDSDTIIVDARSKYHCNPDSTDGRCLQRIKLAFPEAGPRDKHIFPLRNKNAPKDSLKIGIMVSGGIAPGINAVIKGIVDRHILYNELTKDKYDLEIRGFRDGFLGILNDSYINLDREKVRDFANRGGSLLGTSRYDPLLDLDNPQKRDSAVTDLIKALNVDILYIIGGDGSMRAAHMIRTRAQRMKNRRKLSVVCIPKTMDNDILWVWQSFGFMSAAEKAKQFVLQLQTEASSNPRLGIMQLFGSDSGFVVTHAALGSGVCDYVLIPEVDFKMRTLVRHIRKTLSSRYVPGEDGKSPFGMILMAETTIPSDIQDYIDFELPDDEETEYGLELNEKQAIKDFLDAGRRVQGQTEDELRRGGIKIISRVLQEEIRKIDNRQYWRNFRVFTNEPRHLIRAIDPSLQDVIFGQRLGTLAVDNAMAGYTDFMISQWLTEYVLVPLKLVILGRKRVPQNGIFWKSVVANTGQPQEKI